MSCFRWYTVHDPYYPKFLLGTCPAQIHFRNDILSITSTTFIFCRIHWLVILSLSVIPRILCSSQVVQSVERWITHTQRIPLSISRVKNPTCCFLITSWLIICYKSLIVYLNYCSFQGTSYKNHIGNTYHYGISTTICSIYDLQMQAHPKPTFLPWIF